jgi:flagellar motor switch/type III secretory pathway protein FliN
MAAMNRSEMGAGGADPGANLNLDDDSLFAELDSEVMAGDQPGGGDLDFDLDLGGDSAPAAEPADELDLDLGGGGLPGGDDLDLDLGGESAAPSGAGDDLDLDLGGGGDAGMGDMDLDLGETPTPTEEAAPADDAMGDLDLELGGGGGDAGMADLDLDLGGAETAPGDDLDLDLGAPAAAEEPALDLDLDLDALPALDMPAEESPDLALGDMDLDLAPMGDESASLAPAVGEMEPMDLMLDEPSLEAAPELAAGGGDDDLGLGSLSIEPIDLPDEPVFDVAGPAAWAEPAGADAEFHAAADVSLDDEAVSLELQDVDMEPIEDEAAMADDMIALEPAMRADNAVDLGPMSAPPAAMAAEAAEEFIAVPDASVEDEDLLELNLDDLDAVSAAQEATMMQTQSQSQAAPRAPVAMEKAIPAIEQLEIPPESPLMDFPPMEPMPGFDDIGAAPMTARMASPAPVAAISPMAAPRAMRATQPAMAAQAPAPMSGGLLGNDILMAVSHQISVQLGSLSLNGKELMDISYGSVLPLERVIGEPVDLVLENKTIAQAEVVLINGKNLGVRIVALNR